MTHITTDLKSPLGLLRIDVAKGGKIRSLSILAKGESDLLTAPGATATQLLAARQQLESFFCGRLQRFDLAIDFSGYSPFALNVLQTLQEVPFGTTVSYGKLAAMAGRPRAARAVGRVVGANRTPIFIPCHRVVGSNGDLVGYSATGGLVTKRWLLDFELKVLNKV
jgi:methylated-DNA-[protein]-cysteine S-methyltransferase